MGQNNNTQIDFCFGCMEPLPGNRWICPNCGYDNSAAQNGFDILPEGTILHGKYLIGKVLGRGGFGVTYLGLDLINQRRLAIKEYFPIEVSSRITTNRDVVPMTGMQQDFQKGIVGFKNEADVLSLFNSPYVVHVWDFFTEHGTAYIVMEYVRGSNLTAETRNCGGSIDWKRMMELVKPLIFVLYKLHDDNLIHRDIKPDNMIVVKDGKDLEHLVLLDFGSARSYASDMSKKFTALVTPGFAPIEQYSSNSRQGPYTDVYALCCTIYAAILGEKPPASTERLDRNVPVKSLRSSGIDIPENIEKALMHGMALNSSERTQTMKDLYIEMFGEWPLDGQGKPPESHGKENQPDGWQNTSYESAKMAMMTRTPEGYTKALGLLLRISGWRSADMLADNCKQKLAEYGIDYQQFDKKYYDAINKASMNNYDGYQMAVIKLQQIPGWRDADKLLSQYQNIISLRIKAYEHGKLLMSRGDRQSLENAITEFASISGWLDADDLQEECRSMLTGPGLSPETPTPDSEADQPIPEPAPPIIWIAAIILLIVAILIADYLVRKDSSVINLFYNNVVLPFLS